MNITRSTRQHKSTYSRQVSLPPAPRVRVSMSQRHSSHDSYSSWSILVSPHMQLSYATQVTFMLRGMYSSSAPEYCDVTYVNKVDGPSPMMARKSDIIPASKAHDWCR
ncbi:hypothetical protein Hamer_G022039 [Homarus americanus]|uniref:Uncharacterized protein n=1 Tax=Homarus americanus TaxID=6706 RepID=A0A8J5MZP4_HOMAM|nr:hypothetical protein Hamer_G022039 [Homarus americanus]